MALNLFGLGVSFAAKDTGMQRTVSGMSDSFSKFEKGIVNSQQSLSKLAKPMQSAQVDMQKLGKAVGRVADSKVTNTIEKLSSALGAIDPSFIAESITAGSDAISDLAGPIATFEEHTTEIESALKRTNASWNQLQSGAVTAVAGAEKALDSFDIVFPSSEAERFSTAMERLAESRIADGLQRTYDSLVGTTSGVEKLGGSMKSLVDAVSESDPFTTFGNNALDALDAVSSEIDGLGKDLVKFVGGKELITSKGTEQAMKTLSDAAKQVGIDLNTGSENTIKTLMRLGITTDELAQQLVNMGKKASAAGVPVRDFANIAFKRLDEQIAAGAPVNKIRDMFEKGIPDAVEKTEKEFDRLDKSSSGVFSRIVENLRSIRDRGMMYLSRGLDAISGVVSSVSAHLSRAASSAADFVKAISNRGLDKAKQQMSQLVSTMSSLPGQLNSGINLTTGLEAQFTSMGKTARAMAAQSGKSGESLRKFASESVSMAYSLNISEDEAGKAMLAWEAYTDTLSVLGFQSAQDVAKFAVSYGVSVEDIGAGTSRMVRELGFTNEQVQEVMSSAVAAGEEMWNVPGAIKKMGELYPMLEQQRITLGKSAEETADFTKQVFSLSASMYQFTQDSDDAMSQAVSVSRILTDSSVNWEKMMAGMENQLPGLVQSMAKSGVDAQDVVQQMKKGPVEFAKAISSLDWTKLEEGGDLAKFIEVQMGEAFGADSSAQFMAYMKSLGNAEGDVQKRAVEMLTSIQNANEDMGELGRSAFSTGITLQESFDRAVQAFETGFRKHGKAAAREFVSEFRKQTKEFNKTMDTLVSEGGPMGSFIKKMSEVHSLGTLALIPENVRPTAAAFGTMYQQLSPTVTAMQQLGFNVADMINPVTTLGFAVGALAFAYKSARDESQKSVDSMVNSDKAFNSTANSIKSLEKQLSKAKEGTDEYTSLQKQLSKKQEEYGFAQSLRSDQKEIAKYQKTIKALEKQGKDATQERMHLHALEGNSLQTRAKIQDATDARTRQGIEDMIKGSVEKAIWIVKTVPKIVKDVWPEIVAAFNVLRDEIPKVITEIWPMVRDGLKKGFDWVKGWIAETLPKIGEWILDELPKAFGALAAGGGIVGRIVASIASSSTDLASELLAIMDPQITASTTLGKILEAFIGGLQTMLPKLLSNIGYIFSTIDFTALADTISRGLMQALVWVVEELGKLAPIALQALVDVVMAALPNIITGIQKMIPIVIEAVQSMISIVIDTIPVLIPTLLEGIQSILPPLTQGFIDIAMQLLQAIPGIIDTLIASLVPLLGTVIDSLVNIIVTLVPEIVNVVTEVAPDILGALMSAVEMVLSGLVKVVQQIDWGGLLSQVFNTLIDMVTMLLTGDFLSNILDSLLSMIGPLAMGLLTFVSKAVEKLATMDWGKIIGSITNTIVKFVDKLPEVLNPLILKFLEMLPTIIAQIAEVAVKFAILGTVMMVKLSIALIEAAAEMAPTIIWGITKMIFWDLPVAAMGLLWEVLVDILPMMVTSTIDVIGEAFSGIGNVLYSLVIGSIEVIGSLIGRAIDQVKGWVNDALNYVKDLASGVIDYFYDLFGHSVHTIIEKDLGQANVAATQWADFSIDEAGRAYTGMTGTATSSLDLMRNSHSDAFDSMTGRVRRFGSDTRSEFDRIKDSLADTFSPENLKNVLGEGLGTAVANFGAGYLRAAEAIAAQQQRDQAANQADYEKKQSEGMQKQNVSAAEAALQKLRVQKDALAKATALEKEAAALDLSWGGDPSKLKWGGTEDSRFADRFMDPSVAEQRAATLKEKIDAAYATAGVDPALIRAGLEKNVISDVDSQIKQAEKALMSATSGQKPRGVGPGEGAGGMDFGTGSGGIGVGGVQPAPIAMQIIPPKPSITDFVAIDTAGASSVMTSWMLSTQLQVKKHTQVLADEFGAMTESISMSFSNMWEDVLNLTADAVEAIAEDTTTARWNMQDAVDALAAVTAARTAITKEEIQASSPASPFIQEGMDPYEAIAQAVLWPSWYDDYWPRFQSLIAAVKELKENGAVGGRTTEPKSRTVARNAKNATSAASPR